MEKQWLLKELLNNVDIINEAVFNTIIDLDIRSFCDVYNINRFIEIINNHPKSIRSTFYKIKITNKNTKEYVKSFLSSIHESYKEKFEEKELDINFKKRTDVMEEAIFGTKNKIIYIPCDYKISDIYDLTHEFIHYLSIKEEKMNDTLYYFCESLSLFSEFLLEDHLLSTKNNGEYKIENIRKYDGIYVNNRIIKVELDLIRIFLENGCIYKEDIEQIFKNYSVDEVYFIIEYLFYTIEKYNGLDFIISSRYSTGYVIACYMYERIKKYGYNEFIELIENMYKFEIDEFLNYLDLELEDVDYLRLTEDSYKKLEESYVKKIKRIG